MSSEWIYTSGKGAANSEQIHGVFTAGKELGVLETTLEIGRGSMYVVALLVGGRGHNDCKSIPSWLKHPACRSVWEVRI